jgi:para-nitrobenzyl esterase
MKAKLLAWVVIALAVGSGIGVANASPVTVRVAQGLLEGDAGGQVDRYLGVPFAAPPIGQRRWAAPEAAPSWSGVRKAHDFGANCEQTISPQGLGPWTKEYATQGPVSEDCLYLNIWTPARRHGRSLPVMVWIHGGGYTGGSGSVEIYDGANMAARGIVVVTINYRLGVCGFLAHPDLTKESPNHASGNYAFLDQIAALEWIQANISAFGGDPRKVTIAGQSAGAESVHYLMASPLAQGRFSRAIAESGLLMGFVTPDLRAGEAGGMSLQKAAGVKGIDGLRALNAAEIKAAVSKAGNALSIEPVIDGWVLPSGSSRAPLRKDIPVLMGMTANENSAFAAPSTDPAGFNAKLKEVYGPVAVDMANLYPGTDAAIAHASEEALGRDRGLAALHVWAKAREMAQGGPTYLYLWAHSEPGDGSAQYKAFHSSEVPYVFGTLDRAARPFTADDYTLSSKTTAYWVNFVRTGNPNGRGLTDWPRFDQRGRRIMRLDVKTRPEPILEPRRLQVFERYQETGGQLGLF